jgi:arylsulfatase A-like enzyme
LAATSVVFTQAYATSSWTIPSLASLMTSVEPSVHGLMEIAIDPATGRKLGYEMLAPSFVTLAESFSSAGWFTIGVPSNLNVRQGQGFEQGFEQYYGEASFQACDALNREVLDQIRAHPGLHGLDHWKEHPTFLWVHYFDPHDTYEARRPWIELFAPDWKTRRSSYPSGLTVPQLQAKFRKPDREVAWRLRALYESEIRATDEGFRQLSGILGLDGDDVMLIFTSDHGEEFLDHGKFGHRNSLYEELVRVPLFIRWPRGLQPGRIDTPVSLLDIYPTLVELLGLSDPGTLRGRSLVPLLQGKAPASPRPLFAELDLESRELRMVRQGEWALIWHSEAPTATELYELTRDPTQSNNFALRRPEVVQALQDTLVRWRRMLPPPPSDLKEGPKLSQEQIERLRSLGYIR